MSWACIIKKLEVLEQIYGHKVQLKSKSHKKRTSLSIMFQLPPNNKWYLNLVFHPLNTSCKNQELTRHEHDVMAFYTKLYWFHHGRSPPTDVLTTDFFHHRAQSSPFKLCYWFQSLCTFNGHSDLVCFESLIST